MSGSPGSPGGRRTQSAIQSHSGSWFWPSSSEGCPESASSDNHMKKGKNAGDNQRLSGNKRETVTEILRSREHCVDKENLPQI